MLVDLPVLGAQLDAFEYPSSAGNDPGRVGQGGEQFAQDPQTEFAPATGG
jgi:hypothetical protein